MPPRILYLLAAVLMLSACGSSMPRVIQTPEKPPPDARCDEGPVQCSGECPALGAWPAAADGSGDYDDLAAIAIDDAAVLAQCRAKLRACQACLHRLQVEGVISGASLKSSRTETQK